MYDVGATFCGATITKHDFSNSNGVIEFDDDITQIEYNAFGIGSASGLRTIIIPDSVTSIGGSAFSANSGLVSVVLSDSVTSISENGFNDCSSLTSINIPDSVTSIGNNVFKGCTSLVELILPESIESIGREMCTGDTNLIVTCLPISTPEITGPSFLGHPFADVQKVLVPAASLNAYKAAWPEVADKIEAIA